MSQLFFTAALLMAALQVGVPPVSSPPSRYGNAPATPNAAPAAAAPLGDAPAIGGQGVGGLPDMPTGSGASWSDGGSTAQPNTDPATSTPAVSTPAASIPENFVPPSRGGVSTNSAVAPSSSFSSGSQPTVTVSPPAANSSSAPATSSTAPSSLAQAPQQQEDEKEPSPAEVLVRKLLTVPTDDELSGQPVELIDVLGGISFRAQQTRLVAAYWDLAIQTGKYHAARQALARLTKLESSTTAPSAEFKLALSEARIAVEAAHVAVVERQHRLAQERGGVTGQTLPLAADMPHVGGYRTYYETIFAGQPGGEARRIHDTLPLRLSELRARVEGVQAAEAQVESLTSGVHVGRPANAEALAAIGNLRRHQEAFLDVVNAYNSEIAQYAQLASPQGTSGARLVAMLIKTDPARTAAAPAAGANSAVIIGQPIYSGATILPNGVVRAAGQTPSAATRVPRWEEGRPASAASSTSAAASDSPHETTTTEAAPSTLSDQWREATTEWSDQPASGASSSRQRE